MHARKSFLKLRGTTSDCRHRNWVMGEELAKCWTRTAAHPKLGGTNRFMGKHLGGSWAARDPQQTAGCKESCGLHDQCTTLASLERGQTCKRRHACFGWGVSTLPELYSNLKSVSPALAAEGLTKMLREPNVGRPDN